MLGSLLEREPQAKLKLPRIKGRSRRSCLAVQRIYVCHVEAIDNVEHVDDAAQLHTLAKLPGPRDTQVGEDVIRTQAGIAPQVPNDRSIQETCWLEEAGR